MINHGNAGMAEPADTLDFGDDILVERLMPLRLNNYDYIWQNNFFIFN